MLPQILVFVVGLAILLWGSDKLVDSATALALRKGFSTFFVGVTVISIGTSIPEIAITLISALNKAGDIVVGNIIGSEVAQITLAVGIVALISPIKGERREILMYGGGMLAAMVIMILALTSGGFIGVEFFETGLITRFEGILMVLIYLFFLYFIYSLQGGEEVVEGVNVEMEEHLFLFLFLGLILVPLGAHLMVDAGITLAELLGVPQFLIGTLTGLGTTIPEIAVAGLAAYRHTSGISAGALMGSNITDPLFSLGLAGLVADVSVTDIAQVTTSAFYMLFVSALVIGVFAWREEINRWWAALFILLYIPSIFLI